MVSHLDHAIIINLESIKLLAQCQDVEVICRDNIPVKALELACGKYGCHYIANSKQQGFAKNNNDNYLHAKTHLGMTDDDYFILINPDIFINQENITGLLAQLQTHQPSLATINLYLDKEQLLFDDNLRLYPSILDFVKSFVFNDRTTMLDRKKPLPAMSNIWVSGAFLIAKAGLYERNGMLNNKYYMYCEDLDFCYRLKCQNIYPQLLNEISAVHFRRRRSKQIFTQYFYWHVTSVIRYNIGRLFKR